MTKFLFQNNKFKFNNPQVQFHGSEEPRRQSSSEQKNWLGARSYFSAEESLFVLLRNGSDKQESINKRINCCYFLCLTKAAANVTVLVVEPPLRQGRTKQQTQMYKRRPLKKSLWSIIFAIIRLRHSADVTWCNKSQVFISFHFLFVPLSAASSAASFVWERSQIKQNCLSPSFFFNS